MEDQLELIEPPSTTVERDYSEELACIVSCLHDRKYRLRSWTENNFTTIQARTELGATYGYGKLLELPSRFGVPLTYDALVKLAHRVMRECGDHA